MKLILRTMAATNSTWEEEDRSYDVDGLPTGEHANIAYRDQAWRFLRWNDSWHGNWTGTYPTPHAALDALREELAAAV